LESLAAAGAFDSINSDRAAVFGAAETILAHAASAQEQRSTGQAALFGGAGSEPAPIRLPRDASWSLAQRMAGERDAFGFYFSAHPVDAQKHLLAAYKVRTFAEIAEFNIPEGERIGANMAALVEDAKWRTSARGRRYMMATLSDSSGQFMATAFDDDACASLEAAARAQGCGLLTVELDRRAGDETPRISIKRLQPLSELAKRTRLQMTVRLASADIAGAVAAVLGDSRGGNGVIRFLVPLSAGGEASVIAGRDFVLDGELAEAVSALAGEGAVELSTQEPPRLALVG